MVGCWFVLCQWSLVVGCWFLIYFGVGYWSMVVVVGWLPFSSGWLLVGVFALASVVVGWLLVHGNCCWVTVGSCIVDSCW